MEVLCQEEEARPRPPELVPLPDFAPPHEHVYAARELARARLGYISERRRDRMLADGQLQGMAVTKLRSHERAAVDRAARLMGESTKQPTPHRRREPGQATRAFFTRSAAMWESRP